MENTYLYGVKYGDIQVRDLAPKYLEMTQEWLDPTPDDVTIELGTAGGSFLQILRKNAPGIIGSDLNRHILAKHHVANSVTCNAQNLPFRNEVFDKSFSIHTIEHIRDLKSVFKELERVTRENGSSLHAFPAYSIRGLDGAWLDAMRITHNIVKAFFLARELHVHSLNPKRLSQLLVGTTWRIVRAKAIFVPEEHGYSWFVLLHRT